ncbi:TRAP transporter small permease [Psychromarinibacter sp. S121]|uniref:TRAP transporter small permease n=1 Tax=Psychromarinibacter sp. S121 TaxID=3415127 RepID=UPI003C7C11F2
MINQVLRWFIGILIVALVISVAMGVFWRYGLRNSLYWANEVPNVILIWIVFMGSVVAFYERRHIAFSALVDALPATVQRVLSILAELVVLGFLVALVFYGYTIVSGAMNSLSDALKIPRGYFYLCMPISAALMALCSIENLVRLLRGTGAGAST